MATTTTTVKRNRAVNFLPREEYLLLELVTKYKNFIECKNTDSITNKQKEKAWNELTDEFNATSGLYPRSTANLKSKFDNIKRGTKKQLQYEMLERAVSANGTSKLSSLGGDLRTPKLKCVALEGLSNPYFSNSIHDYVPGDGEYVDLAALHPDQFTLTNKSLDDADQRYESERRLQESGEPSNSSSAEHDWQSRLSAIITTPYSNNSGSDKATVEAVTNGSLVPETRLSVDEDTVLKVGRLSPTKPKESRIRLKLLRHELKDRRLRAEREQELHDLKVMSLKLDIALKRKRLKIRKIPRTAAQEFIVEDS